MGYTGGSGIFVLISRRQPVSRWGRRSFQLKLPTNILRLP